MKATTTKASHYPFTAIISTILLLQFTFFLATIIRFGYIFFEFPSAYVLLSIFVTIVYLFSVRDLLKSHEYDIASLILNTFKGCFIATLFIATIAYFDWTFRLPRTFIILYFLLNFYGLSLLYYGIQERSETKKNTLIVGTKKEIIAKVKTSRPFYEVLGYVDDKNQKMALPYLGTTDEIKTIISKYRIERIVIALPKENDERIFDVILLSQGTDVKIEAAAEYDEVTFSTQESQGGFIDVTIQPLGIFNRILKRVFDLIFSSMGMILALPLWIIIPLFIVVDSKGPIFYKQQRVTTYNREFTLYKFRSMVHNAEEKTGPVNTNQNLNDPRITRVGKWLRKYHGDELPQLFNIFKGEMSVVGPRPERPFFDDQFRKTVKDWKKRIYVKPGLTGLAQIHGATNADLETKIKYDLYYLKHQSFFLDLSIILRQFFMLFKK